MFPFAFITLYLKTRLAQLGTLFRDKKLHVPDKDFRFDAKLLSSSYRDRILNETNVSIIPAKSAHLQLNQLSQKLFTWVKRRNKRGPMELVSVSILPDDRSIFLRQASPAKRKLDARMRAGAVPEGSSTNKSFSVIQNFYGRSLVEPRQADMNCAEYDNVDLCSTAICTHSLTRMRTRVSPDTSVASRKAAPCSRRSMEIRPN